MRLRVCGRRASLARSDGLGARGPRCVPVGMGEETTTLSYPPFGRNIILDLRCLHPVSVRERCLRPACQRHGSLSLSYPPFGRHIIMICDAQHLRSQRPTCHRHGSSIITHPPFGIHIILDLRCTASALSAFHPFLSSVRKTYHNDLRCAAIVFSASCLPKARFHFFLLIPNTVQPPITKTNDQEKIDHIIGHQRSFYPPFHSGRCKPSSCK